MERTKDIGNLIFRSAEIKKLLKPWTGMTITEAREKGWGSEQDALQTELWQTGCLLSKIGLE